MTFDSVLASSVVGVVGLAVLAWGAAVSAGSAIRGPEWSSGFLARSRLVWVAVSLAGLMVALFEPRWAGLTISYVGLVAWWLSGRVARGLAEALALGPYVPPSASRQMSVLFRTVLGLVTMAVVAAGFGVVIGRSRFDLTVLAIAVAGLMAAFAWRLWREGTRRIVTLSGLGDAD